MQADELLRADQAALDRARDRLSALIAAATDLEVPIPGSEWSARQAVAHLITATDLYGELANGTASPYPAMDPVVIANENSRRLADIGETEPAKLAALLDDGLERYLEILDGHAGGQQVIWHGGVRAELATLAGVLLAEALIHGFDIARALGRSWPIEAQDALIVLAAYGSCVPLAVDAERTRGLTASIELALEGADAVRISFVDGQLSASDDVEADATLTADPVAFLLVRTGRLDRFPAFALGRLAAGGRRPELAVRFFDLFWTA